MPIKNADERRANHRRYIKQRYHEDLVYREAHKALVRVNQKRYRIIALSLMDDFRSTGCVFCGEKELVCLDAHHVNPDEKDFALSTSLWSGYGGPRIKRELEKCVCVCSNCHRKIHSGLIQVRLGAAAARRAHNPEVSGAIPLGATNTSPEARPARAGSRLNRHHDRSGALPS